MKIWVLYGVSYSEGVAQDNVIGLFYTKEALMEYRTATSVDNNWDNIEYDCFEVIE